MRHLIRLRLHYGLVFIVLTLVPQPSIAAPGEEEVLAAMKKATDFMMNTVSTRGGFVDLYTEDLSERWGEIPARESMIWVQDPGTVSVGRMLLDVYRATADPAFLEYAERAANALIWGQHPSGGWHYFIDFDPAGVPKWYEEVASKCWGWEEFYHYYGNCTFDDNTTTGAAGFLLDLYMTTLDPKYRGPLLEAVGFILESQYPTGGWPQRYPLRYDHPSDRGPDYTSFYTFNDGVIANNIYFLLKAYEQLGNEDYKKAALRGMQFVVIAQLGTPQAGWAQQHDMGLNPAGARTYEPKALAPSTTVGNIRHLMRFYRITGDRRYLRAIPDAIAWLEDCALPPGHSDQGHTHAQFVEVGTNRPLYAHREGTSIEDGRYWVDYEPRNFPGHYGMQLRIDVVALKNEYERVFALIPEEATAEYRAEKEAAEEAEEQAGDDVAESAETAAKTAPKTPPRAGRQRRKPDPKPEPEPEPAEDDEIFACENCDADMKASELVCAKCGHDYGGEPEPEPEPEKLKRRSRSEATAPRGKRDNVNI